MDELHLIYERFVGSLTPTEFMAVEPDDDIDNAVERYVDSMVDDFPKIRQHADDIKRYIRRSTTDC